MVVLEPSATLEGPRYWSDRQGQDFSYGLLFLWIIEDLSVGAYDAAASGLLLRMVDLDGRGRAKAFALASRLYQSARDRRRKDWSGAAVASVLDMLDKGPR